MNVLSGYRLNAVPCAILVLLLAASGPASAQDTMRVTTANVHEFLKKMEAQSKPGMRVNDFVTLASAKASDRVFTIRYLVDAASLGVTAADFSRDDEVAEEKGMCRESNLQKLIKYGAVFERIYEDGAGNMLYRAKIDQNRCRMLK